MKIEKIGAKIHFSAKNSKKFVYYNEELVSNSKFQTHLSRKLQGESFKCPGFVTTISRARKIFFLCGFLLRAIQTTPFCV